MIQNGRNTEEIGTSPIAVRSTSVTGELVITRRRDSGVIIATGQGLWTVEQMHDYMARFTGVVIGVRAQGQPIRVLVDLREASVQQPDVAALIETGAANVYRDGDRCAMLVRSQLVRMQMRRILDPAFHEVFLDQPTAEQWLIAPLRSAA